MSSNPRPKLVKPVKWHGGKDYLADWIISLFPPHLHYVEPYCGGASVLLRRDPNRDWISANGGEVKSHLRGASEVINDVDGELMNFWQVISSEGLFPGFMRQAEATPFSQAAWEAAGNVDTSDPVERAVAFFIRARQSRQGLMKDFATLSRTRTRRRMNEQVSAWLTAIDGLADVHERLKTVVILNDDACKVIGQQDGPDTLFYCDPPYLHETRTAKDAYAHEMSESEHERLLETLARIGGKFVLSGYRSHLYDRFQAENGWNRAEKEIDNKAGGGKQKRKMVECLWMNFDLAAG